MPADDDPGERDDDRFVQQVEREHGLVGVTGGALPPWRACRGGPWRCGAGVAAGLALGLIWPARLLVVIEVSIVTLGVGPDETDPDTKSAAPRNGSSVRRRPWPRSCHARRFGVRRRLGVAAGWGI